MLNRTGDTDREVNVRTNCLTGLSNLQILRLPAGIHYRTGAAYRTAEHFREIFQNLEVLRASYATAAGYENLRIHDINGLCYGLHDVENLHILVVRCKAGIELFHNCPGTLDRLDLLHNACTNRSHLRTVVRTCDRCDGVTAECRTRHQQLVM